MIRLKSIEISNFMGYKKTHIEFPQDGTFLILGENKDDSGAGSNDSGKSALCDAVCWLLTGELPRRKMSAVDVIRRGETKCEIWGILDISGTLVKVCRSRGKSSKSFSFTGSNADLTDSQNQEVFGKLLGVRGDFYSQYMQTTYFNFTQFKAFADPDMSSAERLSILESLFGCSRYVRAGKLAGKKRSEIEVELTSVESSINLYKKVVSEIELLSPEDVIKIEARREECIELGQVTRQQIFAVETTLKKWKDYTNRVHVHELNSVRLGSEISNIGYRIDELERKGKELPVIVEKKDRIEAELLVARENLGKSSFDLYAEMGKKKEEVIQYDAEINALKQKIVFQKSVEYLVCPHCSKEVSFRGKALEKYVADSPVDNTPILESIEKINAVRAGVAYQVHGYLDEIKMAQGKEKVIQDMERSLMLLRQSIDSISSIKVEIEIQETLKKSKTIEFHNMNSSWQTECSELMAELGESSQDLEKRKSQMEIIFQELQREYDSITLKLKINKDSSVKLETYHKSIIEFTTKYKELSGKSDLYLRLSLGFPKVRNRILDGFITLLENSTNHYLSEMGTSTRVEFFLDLSKTTGVFDLKILDNGEEWAFDARGRGKRTRIAICAGFGIRDLYLQTANPFGFMFMDEVADHMDDAGVDMFYALIEKISGQKFVVSHSDSLQGRFSNVLKVTKENDISSAEWK